MKKENSIRVAEHQKSMRTIEQNESNPYERQELKRAVEQEYRRRGFKAIEIYEEFTRDFPDTEYTSLAHDRIQEIYYELLKGDKFDFVAKHYLSSYPSGKYSEKMKQTMDDRQYWRATHSKPGQEQEGYIEYLRSNWTGIHVRGVTHGLVSVMGGIRPLKAYLERHPDINWASKVKTVIDQIETDRYKELMADANSDKCSRFLRDFPDSKHLVEVQKHRDAIEQMEQPAREIAKKITKNMKVVDLFKLWGKPHSKDSGIVYSNIPGDDMVSMKVYYTWVVTRKKALVSYIIVTCDTRRSGGHMIANKVLGHRIGVKVVK